MFADPQGDKQGGGEARGRAVKSSGGLSMSGPTRETHIGRTPSLSRHGQSAGGFANHNRLTGWI